MKLVSHSHTEEDEYVVSERTATIWQWNIRIQCRGYLYWFWFDADSSTRRMQSRAAAKATFACGAIEVLMRTEFIFYLCFSLIQKFFNLMTKIWKRLPSKHITVYENPSTRANHSPRRAMCQYNTTLRIINELMEMLFWSGQLCSSSQDNLT